MKIYVRIPQHPIRYHRLCLAIVERDVRYRMSMISHQLIQRSMMDLVYRKDFVQSNPQQVIFIDERKHIKSI